MLKLKPYKENANITIIINILGFAVGGVRVVVENYAKLHCILLAAEGNWIQFREKCLVWNGRIYVVSSNCIMRENSQLISFTAMTQWMWAEFSTRVKFTATFNNVAGDFFLLFCKDMICSFNYTNAFWTVLNTVFA